MNETLFVISAHCDDAELWAGGTIARWLAAGGPVSVAIDQHTDARRAEAMAGSRVIGFDPLFRPALVAEDWIDEILHDVQPAVVLTHPADDPHPDHQRVHRSVVAALVRSQERRAYPKRWYAFDTYYLTGPAAGCPVLIDISEQFAQKRRAIECHSSQNVAELVRMAEAMGRLRGMQRRAEYAEAFHAFPLLGRWPPVRELP